MFGWLRRLFSRKKESTEENLVEMKEEVPKPEPVSEPSERLAPHSTHEPERPEKACPKCGSPNDAFVHKCWMCKAEI